MKLLRSLKLLITNDAKGAEKLFEYTFEQTEESASVVAAESDGVRTIAAGATVALPLGGITTARYVLIVTDVDVKVTLNGGAQEIDVKKGTSTRGVFFLEGSITAVSVRNPGGTDAKVLYVFAGV